MNNTIDFNTAKTIGTMSKKIDHIDDTVSSFFSFMHMVMQNELGNAEPYFAATSPVLDLTVIRPDDAPHILPCFDEADEGISIDLFASVVQDGHMVLPTVSIAGSFQRQKAHQKS